jgi:23S rRNA pseudouridine2605 synthase/23S rRNA pseudouridine2604 synthase
MTRLNKFLAANRGVSRREADRLIAEGKVRLNGGVVTDMGVQVGGDDFVELEGRAVKASPFEYYKYHKPRCLLTAYGDGRGKETLESVPLLAEKKLAYSGRLDYDSEGLILFTNDGDLILRLQKSLYKAEKEYIVWTERDLREDWLEHMREGLSTEEGDYLPCEAEKLGRCHFRLVLTEGKKRQIRNMFRHFGVRVRRLMRVRIGNVTLEGLKAGEIKKLSEKEITELKKCTE